MAVDPLFGRAGIARDSSTGEYVLWAVEDDAYWPDRNGAPVPVDPALLKHGSLDPGDVATVLSTIVELDALADMPLEAAGGMRAIAETLLGDAKNPKHPLHPFMALLERSWPETWKRAYSGAFWSHRPNGRVASDMATQVVSVLGDALNDPLVSKATWKERPASTAIESSPTKEATEPGPVGKDPIAALALESPLTADTAAAKEGVPEDAATLSGSSLSLHSVRRQEDGSFVVWNDLGDRPALGAEGGTLTGRVTDDSGRFAVVTDSVTGTIAIFDLRRGEFFADHDGAIVAVPEGSGPLTIDEDLNFAQRLAANIVAVALSEKQQERAATRTSLDLMLREIEDEDHLFHLSSGPVSTFLLNYDQLRQQGYDGTQREIRLAATGPVAALLNPDYVETRVAHQLKYGTPDFETLRNRFASVTGYNLVEDAGGAGSAIVHDAAGAPIVHIAPTLAMSFIADPQGAEKLDTLAAWQSGAIGATEAAVALLEALQGSGDEEAAAEIGDAIFALEEAIAEGRIDRSQAATLLIPALYPDAELPLEFVQDLILDTLPIIGNIRSAEAFVEDIEAVGLAIENDDWWAASGNTLLAVLDLAGVFPGMGFIVRPIRRAFIRVARGSAVFRRVHSGSLLLWMERQARRPGMPTSAEEYFGGVWPHLTSQQQKSLRGLYPNIIGAAGEQHLYNMLEDIGYSIVRGADVDNLTDLARKTAVSQHSIPKDPSHLGRRHDALIDLSGSLMEIAFGFGRRSQTGGGTALEIKVNNSDFERQAEIDDVLIEQDVIAGAVYLRTKLRDLDPNILTEIAMRYLSKEKYASFTEAQKRMISDDIVSFYKNGDDALLLFDFFVGLELRAMASLHEDLSALEPAG